MSQNFILLDTRPLGMITNRPGNPECQAIQQWFNTISDRILLPEISDYELRRELLRANKQRGLRQLDQLKTSIPYLPITTQTMLKTVPLEKKDLGRSSLKNDRSFSVGAIDHVSLLFIIKELTKLFFWNILG